MAVADRVMFLCFRIVHRVGDAAPMVLEEWVFADSLLVCSCQVGEMINNKVWHREHGIFGADNNGTGV